MNKYLQLGIGIFSLYLFLCVVFVFSGAFIYMHLVALHNRMFPWNILLCCILWYVDTMIIMYVWDNTQEMAQQIYHFI